jgi:hypothetical protein
VFRQLARSEYEDDRAPATAGSISHGKAVAGEFAKAKTQNALRFPCSHELLTVFFVSMPKTAHQGKGNE